MCRIVEQAGGEKVRQHDLLSQSQATHALIVSLLLVLTFSFIAPKFDAPEAVDFDTRVSLKSKAILQRYCIVNRQTIVSCTSAIVLPADTVSVRLGAVRCGKLPVSTKQAHLRSISQMGVFVHELATGRRSNVSCMARSVRSMGFKP